MEYKHYEEFEGIDVEAADREGAPNRHVGMVHARSGWNYPMEPMSKQGFSHSLGMMPLGMEPKRGFSHSLGMMPLGMEPMGMESMGMGLDMPSLSRKTMEKSQSLYNVDDLYDARSKPITLPHLQEMPISDLTSPYNKMQVIKLEKPEGLDVSGCDKYIRETFGISYGVLQDMAPAVTFKPNNKALKCRGSFTQDFSTCRFEAQVWRVQASHSEQENIYILEFRQKTLSGRDAFEYLISKMAAALKEAGRAKVYGNGMEIIPLGLNSIPDDLGEFAMPSFGGMGSCTSISCENNNKGFPINLENGDLLNSWCEIIAERKWPAYEETLRTLARCCCDGDNKKVIAEHPDLQKALIKDLQLEMDATSCQNNLTVLYAILEEASCEQCVVEDGILLGVAQTFMTHTGLNLQRGTSKLPRSVSLERVALKILLILSEKPKQYNQKQVQEVLQVLDGAHRKLKDEVNQQHLEYVIGNLKNQSQ